MKKTMSKLIGVFIGIVSAALYVVGTRINGTSAADLTFFGIVGLCLAVVIIAFQIGLSMESKAEP